MQQNQDELRGAKSFARDCLLVLVYLTIPLALAFAVYGVLLGWEYVAGIYLAHL